MLDPHTRSCLCTITALLALGLAGCNGGGRCAAGQSGCLTATFTVVGQTEFFFAEPAGVSNTGSAWGVDATDYGRRYSILIIYTQDAVPQPGEYPADLGLSKLGMMIGRPHPTDPNQVRLSSTKGGTIRFDHVGYQDGDLVDGTFDGIELVRNEPDDTIHIVLSDGTFSATVGAAL